MSKKEDTQNYLIFARKFRPQTFDEVIGQEPITTTLKNAIKKDRVAQSFLFTGSRGVGKTSTARILAKALNCEKGPAVEPCNQCVSCDEITRGTSLDILEIDGASNRGIDEIRALRENVKFKPTHGRYKIYIIDEVHQITHDGFNALLKTLEEPPPHVKFIFATTEAHKVPLTILSRCQRFNFRRIPTAEVVAKLKEVAREEKIKISDQAIFLIAKQSEGSLRDAEGLLDQMASFSGSKIEETDITFSLGLAESGVYFSILSALKERNTKEILTQIAKLSDEGKDLNQFAKGLVELFRNLLVFQVGGEAEKLIEGSDEELAELQKFKSAFSREELLFSLTLLQQLAREIRWAQTPRFSIEACLLKIAHRSDLKSIDEILKELKSFPKSNFVIPAEAGIQAHRSPTLSEKNVEFFPKSAPRTGASVKDFGDDLKSKEPQKKKDNFELEQAAVATSPEELPRPAFQRSAAIVSTAKQPNTVILRPKADKEETAPTKPKVVAGSTITISDVGRVWPDLLERVKAIKMSCGTYLAESEPVEVVDGFVVFGFPVEFKFHKEAIEHQSNKELVRSTLNTLLGATVNVSFVVTQPVKNVTTSPVSSAQLSDVKESEIITSALNIFEGSKVVRRDPN
ncbi:MAG: DNA polymerase III, subunit gamma and tau [Omnitrophica bacterium RIFCSPHIGHO2_02_FULL_46_11]|nr:MAG: DNA polymerase III, subunit gamma and tau [Omnitrophica bacterium RIFCSPHIGHO2_02_FULL_46_11]